MKTTLTLRVDTSELQADIERTENGELEGPCAAIKVPWYKRLANAVGTAIGEAKFDQ